MTLCQRVLELIKGLVPGLKKKENQPIVKGQPVIEKEGNENDKGALQRADTPYPKREGKGPKGEEKEASSQRKATSTFAHIIIIICFLPLIPLVVLEWLFLFLTIAPCDAAEPWQLGSQDAATPMMQGIIDLHHDIFFFLILILVFVSRILVRALWHFHYKKNPIPQRIVHGTTIEIFGPYFLVSYRYSLLYHHLLCSTQWMR